MRNASGQLGYTDKEFIDVWRTTGGRAKEVAQRLGGMNIRNVYTRRNMVEERHKISLPSAGDFNHKGRGDAGEFNIEYKPRLSIDGFTGTAVVFSDCHWWPGLSETPAYRGLLKVIRELKPKLIIANGDILDGAKISRFPPDGWEKRPRMADELDEVKTRMAEIRHCYRGARLIRTIGNHCLDDQTECLTQRGWLKWNQLTTHDKVLSWNDGKTVWSNIDSVISRHHRGPMVRIEKNRMSMSVTPEHRVLLKKLNWRSQQYDIVEYRRADDLPSSFNIPMCGSNDGFRINRSEVFTEQYEGTVWCLSVPLTNFMVRRKGAAYFTGNCTRFDRYLAVNSSDFEGIDGFRLRDHLPQWEETVSIFINKNCMVKHRYHGGIHAGYNNVVKAGTSMVTGHTHLLEIRPFSDYRGRRYGVQTGTLADPHGPQFGYAEDAPSAQCSGFAVLTFDQTGRLLYPEIAEVIDGDCWFRGQKIVRAK